MSRVFLVPVFVFLVFESTFIVSYIWAVWQDHVAPVFPYISDTGTFPPESCLFGQLMNIGGLLLATTVYLRYLQVLELCAQHSELGAKLLQTNEVAKYFGFASPMGISIVANFQETNVPAAHYSGAFICFGSGTIYFLMQAVISYRLQPISGSMMISHIRLAMGICCAVFFFVQLIAGIISHRLYKGNHLQKWYPSDGGYDYHLASTISEWIVASLYSLFVLTFTGEFLGMQIERPKVILQA